MNISDVLHPVEIGYLENIGNVYRLVVNGNYAYLACWDGGFRIIDVSNPSAPVQISVYYAPGVTAGVALKGNYVYLANSYGTNYTEGVSVLDISDPIRNW